MGYQANVVHLCLQWPQGLRGMIAGSGVGSTVTKARTQGQDSYECLDIVVSGDSLCRRVGEELPQCQQLASNHF